MTRQNWLERGYANGSETPSRRGAPIGTAERTAHFLIEVNSKPGIRAT